MGNLDLLSSRLGQHQSDLDLPLCVTCSTQTSYKGDDLDCQASDAAYKCPICLDPRQYIGIEGQKWTTLRTLIESNTYHNDFHELVAGQVWTIKTRPAFGVGQRAFLLKTAQGELIMWDCVAYLDDATLHEIDRLSGGKGISHMVVSHPHYYSTTATWLAAFPQMTLWLAQEDFEEWYQRRELVKSPSRIKLIGKIQVQTDVSEVKILLLGGHFPGSLVLLFKDMLFIADTIQVVPSGRYKSDQPQRRDVISVSFLWRWVLAQVSTNYRLH